MERLVLEMPHLYGDHHVVEVRRILFDIPGVQEVYASSAFQMVDITYDPAQVNDLEIRVQLDNAGYLGEWSGVTEHSIAVNLRPEGSADQLRHTAVFEQTRQVVGFSQNVQPTGRPLWQCPGMGTIKGMDEE